jgi:hypothetical protein
MIDVQGSKQEMVHRMFGHDIFRPDFCKMLDCDRIASRPIMGYECAALLKRDGQTVRVDYSPTRLVMKKTKLTLETYRGSIDDPGLTGSELAIRRGHSDTKTKYLDRDTGEILDHYDPEKPGLEVLSVDDGLFEQSYIDKERLPFLRVEGNPAKFPGFDQMLGDIGKAVTRDRAPSVGSQMRPTRIDVAVDYPVPIDHFGVTVGRKRVENQRRVVDEVSTTRVSGRLETMYLGSPGGNQMRVYDKVEEIAHAHRMKRRVRDEELMRKAIEASGYGVEWHGKPITRFEVALREMKTEQEKKVVTMADLLEMTNPFVAVEVGENTCVTEAGNWKETAFAYMVQAIGLNAALKQMPPNTRTAWRKRLGIRVERDGKGGVNNVFGDDASPILHPASVHDSQYLVALRAAVPSLLH